MSANEANLILEKVAPSGPPPSQYGAWGWVRRNLFSPWYNAVLTLVALYIIYRIAVPLFTWGFRDAVWVGSAEDCHAAAGACWAVVGAKYRFMLFGTYPYDQQWRPMLAVLIFVAMAFLSTRRQFWQRWLIAAWAAALAVMFELMRGGILGLSGVPTGFWGGLPLTIGLAISALVLAFPLAVLLALGRRSTMPAIRAISVGYIELVRGVPLVTVLFMASVMFPLFLPQGITIDNVLRAGAGMLLFAAAYLAEVIRGGLQAIPKGQYEAADALGLGYFPKMTLIILPQALRLVIPPIVNSFIATFQDTSLVIIVGLFDFLGATRLATSDPVWRSFTTDGYVFAALIYFLFCYFMSKYSQRLERVLSTAKHR